MLRKIKQDTHVKSNKKRWLVSFADLISILLTFFVMLYASKAQEQASWQKISGSFSNFFDGYSKLSNNETKPALITSTPKPIKKHDINYFETSLKNLAYKKDYSQSFTLEKSLDNLKISLYFKAEKSLEVINFISNLLKQANNKVEIEVFEYTQEKSLNISQKIISIMNLKDANKKILIKLNQEVLLPETDDVKKNINLVTITIYSDEETI